MLGPFGEVLAAKRSDAQVEDEHYHGLSRLDAQTHTTPLRSLNAVIGRFTAPEPLIVIGGFDPVDPALTHSYAYAVNDSVNFADRSGLNPSQQVTQINITVQGVETVIKEGAKQGGIRVVTGAGAHVRKRVINASVTPVLKVVAPRLGEINEQGELQEDLFPGPFHHKTVAAGIGLGLQAAGVPGAGDTVQNIELSLGIDNRESKPIIPEFVPSRSTQETLAHRAQFFQDATGEFTALPYMEGMTPTQVQRQHQVNDVLMRDNADDVEACGGLNNRKCIRERVDWY